jgi:DinB superfamily
MQALAPATLQPPVSLLEKTPALLEILLRDIPQELFQWKPAPDRWSIAEVLAHLVVIEQLYGERARRMVMEENPTLTTYVAPSEDELHKKSAQQSLEKFVALRRAHIIFLHTIPSTSGARRGEHVELGSITLSQLLNEMANHDLGHLRQIAELYRAQAFFPFAGPFQKYSQPQP